MREKVSHPLCYHRCVFGRETTIMQIEADGSGLRTIAEASSQGDDWKALVRSQGGDPVLLDASLFSGTASRNKELMQRFSLMGAPLVDLALTHEMGHGICEEKDERRADNYGKDLRDGKIPDCSKTSGWKATAGVVSVSSAVAGGPPR